MNRGGLHTFVRHLGARLQVEPLAGASANLVDVVAQSVAAMPPTVQADASVEAALVSAPVGHALLVLVKQRVDEEMDGSLMGTFDCLLKPCDMMRWLNFRTGFVDFWFLSTVSQKLCFITTSRIIGHVTPSLSSPKSIPLCQIFLF